MTYPEHVKSVLWADIDEMAVDPGRFATNPKTDFSRNRKINFTNLLQFSISMESGSTNHELIKYFDFDDKVPSCSAFYQQRSKLLPDAYSHLIKTFNSHFPLTKYKDKYYLVACDGCEFNITRNPDDPDTFHPPSGKSTKGFNMLHTISFYDVLSKRYLDLITQPARKKNEFQAICDLMNKYSYGGKPIIIADRGFASYNVFAHAIENGLYFAIRAKDVNVKRLLKLDSLPAQLDKTTDIILTRTQSKKNRLHPEKADAYRYICKNVTFDYLGEETNVEYPMSLRIVRFEVADGIYENIITNLPADEFPIEEIRQIYHLRWNIETSFRDLKHTIGTSNFHSKKVKYIEQEIWARMILFNFCSIIIAHVVIEKTDTKHIHQVNFAMAMKICHGFLQLKAKEKPPNIEGLIGKFTLPIRPNRNYARQHRFQLPASFAYRLS